MFSRNSLESEEFENKRAVIVSNKKRLKKHPWKIFFFLLESLYYLRDIIYVFSAKDNYY